MDVPQAHGSFQRQKQLISIQYEIVLPHALVPSNQVLQPIRMHRSVQLHMAMVRVQLLLLTCLLPTCLDTGLETTQHMQLTLLPVVRRVMMQQVAATIGGNGGGSGGGGGGTGGGGGGDDDPCRGR
jgi:uncharacterized membrane protein YgcG